jgi:diguanylate cyclase (GGDEF)-like protein
MIRLPAIFKPIRQVVSEFFRYNYLKNIIGRLIKRMFDFLVALLGLIVLLPFLGFIAIIAKRNSPGPIFYWGPRVGKGGRPFKILKFRTMYECPESYQGPRVTGKGDERITPLGQWLRDTKINELPQLWNVLIGEMSLVGPRPEDPEIVKTWSEEDHQEILSIRPGITSPASILYQDEENLLSTVDVLGEYFEGILPDKMRLDRLYVRSRSFTADLDILFWTMVIFIPRVAKLRIPEGYLFAGPLSRLFNRYVSWFLIDLLISFGAAGVIGFLWRSLGPLHWGSGNLAIMAIILALLFSGVNSVAGLNRIVWSRAVTEDGFSLALSSGFATFLVLLLNQIQTIYQWLPFPPLPTAMLFTIGVVAGIGFLAARFRLRVLTVIASRWLTWRGDGSTVGERILIIGSGEGCQIANWLLSRRVFRTAFTIVGIVDDEDPTLHGMRVHGCLVLGGIGDLPALVEKYDVGAILAAIPSEAPEIKGFVLDICEKSNVRLVFLEDILGMVDKQLAHSISATKFSLSFEQRLEFITMHDALTGLPNRYLLQDRLKQSLAFARRYNTQQAVIFIGLEELKNSKNIIEKSFRETVLKSVTERLLSLKRESDTLGCYGKYEFALILENISNEEVAEMVAKRILASLSKPFEVDGHTISIYPRIEICTDPHKCEDTVPYGQTDIDLYYDNRRAIEVINRHEDLLEE